MGPGLKLGLTPSTAVAPPILPPSLQSLASFIISHHCCPRRKAYPAPAASLGTTLKNSAPHCPMLPCCHVGSLGVRRKLCEWQSCFYFFMETPSIFLPVVNSVFKEHQYWAVMKSGLQAIMPLFWNLPPGETRSSHFSRFPWEMKDSFLFLCAPFNHYFPPLLRKTLSLLVLTAFISAAPATLSHIHGPSGHFFTILHYTWVLGLLQTQHQ